MGSAWSILRGHSEQRALFAKSVRSNRLSHAYVLAGPDGIGKRAFARLLAQSTFCRECPEGQIEACGECRACRSFSAGTWPDYIEIARPEGKGEIPVAAIAGSPDKRGREGLCFELSMAPQASTRRVAVIDEAHLMNTEGANALLKTLEEPPAKALILLICDSPDSLLPTIRSRCQIIRFFPLSDADVHAVLLEQKFTEDPAEAAAVAAISEGSLTLAQQLLHPGLRQLRELVATELTRFDQMKPLEISKQIADELQKISAGLEEQRQHAQWVLRFLTDALSNALKRLASGDFSDPLLQRLGVRCGTDLLSGLLDRILQASRHIEGNSPLPLVLDALFDDLARAMRLGPASAR
jgi:DNA polymerase-3 subunit delta'